MYGVDFANTQYKGFKVHYREYLDHQNEPEEGSGIDGAAAELKSDLLRNIFYQKRRMRRVAKRLRQTT
jgi:hypothetical protein